MRLRPPPWNRRNFLLGVIVLPLCELWMLFHSQRDPLSSNNVFGSFLPLQWRGTETHVEQRLVASFQTIDETANEKESSLYRQSRQLKKGNAVKGKRKSRASTRGGGGDKGHRKRPKPAPVVSPTQSPALSRTVRAIEGISCTNTNEDKKNYPQRGGASKQKGNKKYLGKTKDSRTRGESKGKKKDPRKRANRLLVEEDSSAVHCSFDELSLGDLDGQRPDMLSECRGLVDVRASSIKKSIEVKPTHLDCHQRHLQRRRPSRRSMDGDEKSVIKRRPRSSGQRSRRRIHFFDCPDHALGIRESDTHEHQSPSVHSDLYQRQLQEDIFADDSMSCMTFSFDPGVSLADLGISGLSATNTASCTVSCVRILQNVGVCSRQESFSRCTILLGTVRLW